MPPEPLVLGFDTSAAHCAAALLCGDDPVARRHEEMGRGQAERLFPLLEELLSEAGAGWRDLAGIGVGIGPGNFTGVRISVAAARGLALSLGIPAIGVAGFDALAEGQPGPVLASLDARRGLAYLALAGDDRPLDPVLGAPDTVALPAPAGTPCIGHAAETLAARLDSAVASPAFPLAIAIGRVAARRLGRAHPRPAPLYVRPADAAPPAEAPPVILP